MGWSDLDPVVIQAIGVIYSILIVATLTGWLLPKIKTTGNFTELQQRITTWWMIITLFSLAIVSGKLVAILFFAFVSFLALKEYLSLIPTRRADRRVLFWAYLSIPFQYFWVYIEWYGVFIIFIPVYMFLLLPFRMLSIGNTDGFLKAAGTLHWGLMITVFSLSHAAFLMVLRLQDDLTRTPGPGLVLFLAMLTQLNDVAQYVWGKTLGRHKVIPTVSPGKTWEGLIGGMLTTTLVGTMIGPYLTPMLMWQSALGGFIIAVAGFVGDINISALKRDLHIKDSGNMLPGHGGILDRVDSLTYTAPLFFHYIYYSFLWQTHGMK